MLYFSYHSNDKRCHVPHQSGASVGSTFTSLDGSRVAGFTSYFMQTRTIPSFSTSVSVSGTSYWRTAVDGVTDNADILGVHSASECYTICELFTSGNCWIFRYDILF